MMIMMMMMMMMIIIIIIIIIMVGDYSNVKMTVSKLNNFLNAKFMAAIST
jgi:hypothetical protein